MNPMNARIRGWVIWLLPFVALVLVIGWEGDWGRKWRHVPATDMVVVPQPVVVAVLPDYLPVATLATQRDMVERALFNPTRRPAPVAAPEALKKRIQPGQFMLTGTLIIDGKSTAFLRESAGGKSRRVVQGEQINGMLVSEVKADRVRLTMGDEFEDLLLKVASGPKTTTQPAVVPVGAPPGMPVTGGTVGGSLAATTADQLAERRRAQTAAQAAAAPPPLNAPPAGAYARPGGGGGNVATPAQLDPRWGETDARLRSRVPQPPTTK